MEFVLKENKRLLETYFLQTRIVGGDGVIHHFEFQKQQGRQLDEQGQ